MMLPVANRGTIAIDGRLVQRKDVCALAWHYLFGSYTANSVSILVDWLISHIEMKEWCAISGFPLLDALNYNPATCCLGYQDGSLPIEKLIYHLWKLQLVQPISMIMATSYGQQISCPCTHTQGCWHHTSFSPTMAAYLIKSLIVGTRRFIQGGSSTRKMDEIVFLRLCYIVFQK